MVAVVSDRGRSASESREFYARSSGDLMNALSAPIDDSEFLKQARRCRSMGSPFVASVLEAADRQLAKAPVTARMIDQWPGDPAAAALAMRVNAALHALARRATPDYLAQLYSGEHDDFDGAVAEAFSQQDTFIANWISTPTQTNEVARAAAIMSALMAVQLPRPMPFELFEMGSSCGLNLNLARYSYKLGPVAAGDPMSAVTIEPRWRGLAPRLSPISIISARGVDLQPLNASQAGDRERLLAFAWADQPARSKRLDEALQIAVRHPPRVDRGDAATWLARRMIEPQSAGTCRAVFHSMVLQYLHEHEREDITATMTAAGARASVDRPLVWISFEWTTDRREVQLRLTCWPAGTSVVLARCDPYGDWLDWSGTGAGQVLSA